MATFDALQLTSSGRRPDGGEDNSDEDSSADEEYLPENDRDADTSDDAEEAGSESACSCDGEAVAPASKPKRRSKLAKSQLQPRVKGQFVARASRGVIRLEGRAAAAEEVVPETAAAGPISEHERKRADALWASFLSDVGPRPARESSGPAASTAPAERRTEPVAKFSSSAVAKATTKVFDFAGESVTVEVPMPDASAATTTSAAKRRPSAVSGGVRGLLDSLAKRPKLSTLEKSRLDWETFKSKEGIAEDLATHNRGKAGFLERQAFLERADYRQFERERDARLASGKRPG